MALPRQQPATAQISGLHRDGPDLVEEQREQDQDLNKIFENMKCVYVYAHTQTHTMSKIKTVAAPL